MALRRTIPHADLHWHSPIYFQIGGEGAASSAYVTDALTMYEYGKTHGALLVR